MPSQAKASETSNPQRTQLLTSLKDHAAWQELKNVADERRDEEMRHLWGSVMRGTVSEIELAQIRGFMRGMQYLLNFPEVEAKQLKRTKERSE